MCVCVCVRRPQPYVVPAGVLGTVCVCSERMLGNHSLGECMRMAVRDGSHWSDLQSD